MDFLWLFSLTSYPICIFLLLLSLFKPIHFKIVILIRLPQFFLLCPPPPSLYPAPTVNPHTIVQVHRPLIHVLSIVPSQFSHHYPPPSFPLATVILFYVSISLALFFSLVYFVHQIPVINEVMCVVSVLNSLIECSF